MNMICTLLSIVHGICDTAAVTAAAATGVSKEAAGVDEGEEEDLGVSWQRRRSGRTVRSSQGVMFWLRSIK